MDEKLFGETKFYVDLEMTTEAKPGDRVAVVVSANGSRMLSSQRPEERPILATREANRNPRDEPAIP